MDFINETEYPAFLFRSEFEPDRLYNSLLLRIRYIIESDFHLRPAQGDEIPEDVQFEMIEDDYGTLEPDLFFSGTGTDLMIIGDAVSAQGSVTEHSVRLAAGPPGKYVYDMVLAVFGNRFWEKNTFGNLVPSKPFSFESLPLTYKNAYGGTAKSEYGEIPFVHNPVGKGYYLKEENAVGQPLPNIEDPYNLIRQWDDKPDPAGIAPYPIQWGLRAMKAVSVDEKKEKTEFTPERGFFNKAYPQLSMRQLNRDHQILVKGMSRNGDIAFRLPACPFETEIRLGNKVHVRDLQLEEVLIDLRSFYVDLSYRKKFDYAFVPFQTRTTTLRHKDNEAV
jgi:hypothetical protein